MSDDAREQPRQQSQPSATSRHRRIRSSGEVMKLPPPGLPRRRANGRARRRACQSREPRRAAASSARAAASAASASPTRSTTARASSPPCLLLLAESLATAFSAATAAARAHSEAAADVLACASFSCAAALELAFAPSSARRSRAPEAEVVAAEGRAPPSDLQLRAGRQGLVKARACGEARWKCWHSLRDDIKAGEALHQLELKRAGGGWAGLNRIKKDRLRQGMQQTGGAWRASRCCALRSATNPARPGRAPARRRQWRAPWGAALRLYSFSG